MTFSRNGRALDGVWRRRTASGGRDAAPLDVAQDDEDGGDVGGGVLVDAVQADQGVEDEQARRA